MKFTCFLIILPILASSVAASAIPAVDTEPALEARRNCVGDNRICEFRRPCCPGLRCMVLDGWLCRPWPPR
ncbi:Protein of unknown function [Pyronema omphalodes CBS 100304]|uniref:Uncharacterized protein n=1 Tax=Pyronema omphalodes (strain CBS 100304) TaxID=1076935 RepID=U4L5P4_PYROM|nr:Protein of unknown function [Pyronema omphalodes CBS 100304]